MSSLLGVPVDAVYHLVSAFAGILTPLLGGLAAAAAIVLVTVSVRLLLLPLSYRAMRAMDAQGRIAPRVQALRASYGRQPARLQRELAALQQSEGAGMLAGCLPLLLQWPVLSVMYLLFRSPEIGGAPNLLLTHDLLGAPLGSHWLSGAGPLSTQGTVFAALFVVLGGTCWLSARLARRRSATGGAQQAGTAVLAAGVRQPDRQSGGSASPAAAGRVQAALARLVPFISVAIAAVVPLAAGLYLVTTTAWTLAERALLH